MSKKCYWLLAFLASLQPLFAEVTLLQNPMQQFNLIDNYANRVIYFFVQKNRDGSVTLQISAPPFYAENKVLLDKGAAYIDCEKVIQNYTANKAKELIFDEISFTVNGIANPNSLNGSILYATIYPWGVNLDVTSQNLYSVQSTDNVFVNPSIGGFTLFSNLEDLIPWVSSTEGVFFSNSLTDNILIKTNKANTLLSKKLTITVNFSAINKALTGIYSTYFFFQMSPLDQNETFLQTITNLSSIQQVQLNYLEQNIIVIDAYLSGNNTLYKPIALDKSILVINKTLLLNRYKATLDAMSIKWEEYSALINLSADELAIIVNMKNYLAFAARKFASFS